MGFGEVVIKLQSFRRRCLCSLVRLFSRKSAQETEPEQIHVRIGQPRISQSIAGVLVDRLVETFDALLQSLLCSLLQEIATFQIHLMLLAVFSGTRRDCRSLRTGELRLKGISNLRGDLAFDSKDVGQ